jgi:hypothetical protein
MTMCDKLQCVFFHSISEKLADNFTPFNLNDKDIVGVITEEPTVEAEQNLARHRVH